jgi:ubiquitin-protein ligase
MELFVTNTTNVYEIKQAACQQFNLDEYGSKILANNREWRDNDTVGQMNLTSKDRVFVVYRLRGGGGDQWMNRTAAQEIVVQMRYVKRLKGVLSFTPIGNNIRKCRMLMQGPEGSPYEGGVFSFILKFPASYPWEPPVVSCETPIFHPNIFDGYICWHEEGETGQRYFLDVVIASITNVLLNPNPGDGYDFAAYERKARQYTQEHAYA